jgi:hypothetical protein
MFKNMKPLPKALIIAAIVGLPIGAYMKFAPKSAPAPVVEAVAPTAVPAEASTPVATTAPAPVAPVPVTPAPAPRPAPANDAGLNNLLK